MAAKRNIEQWRNNGYVKEAAEESSSCSAAMAGEEKMKTENKSV